MKCCHILHIDLLMSHLIVYNFIIEPLINELNYLFIFNFGIFRRIFLYFPKNIINYFNFLFNQVHKHHLWATE